MKECSHSIGQSVFINRWIDSIVYNMTSSVESNWVTELYTLECLGEENTLPNIAVLCYNIILYYISEEVLMFNWSECIDQQSV